MAQLYANENSPLPVVVELRQLGHNVLTTYESGRAGVVIPDDEVLAFTVTSDVAQFERFFAPTFVDHDGSTGRYPARKGLRQRIPPGVQRFQTHMSHWMILSQWARK